MKIAKNWNIFAIFSDDETSLGKRGSNVKTLIFFCDFGMFKQWKGSLHNCACQTSSFEFKQWRGFLLNTPWPVFGLLGPVSPSGGGSCAWTNIFAHFFASAFGEYPPVAALSFICVPQATYPGGIEPRQAVSPRPEGQGRYRFTTASANEYLRKWDIAAKRRSLWR